MINQRKSRLMAVDAWYLENLVCPRDHGRLVAEQDGLCCLVCRGTYPVVAGIPVMLRDDVEQTIGVAQASIRCAHGQRTDMRAPDLYLETLGVNDEEKTLAASLSGTSAIDPVVSVLIGATSGNMYRRLIGSLDRYPIPALRLEPGSGKRFLDIGCNWGRWSIAATRLGYQAVGIDPSLGAILAARRVSTGLGIDIKYVVADGRYLPFGGGCFDVVFSYSVLQHFSKNDVAICLREVSRLLKIKGYCFIQLANAFGIRSFYHQLKRGFQEPKGFDVRYWSPRCIQRTCNALIGKTTLAVDGYFGLGIQESDWALMPGYYKAVIALSETLRRISTVFVPLVYGADSLYAKAIKIGDGDERLP
ncbi:MAG TPA: methyltransferase domain-containing protein [Candidatus Omnitrophota bacterium]|nr:methyltransferase domain-containing protein [Candidatus Omnitrophota bacterium]